MTDITQADVDAMAEEVKGVLLEEIEKHGGVAMAMVKSRVFTNTIGLYEAEAREGIEAMGLRLPTLYELTGLEIEVKVCED